jgi:hypothetical protein
MSLSINKNFIGYRSNHKLESYSGSDTYENYTNQLKIKDKDWYYRTHDITYERNSLGHRCKELSEINFNDYILTIGCSNTEGIGLELQKTYPYVLAERLNCSYYNLGLGGSGIDVLNHNLTMWMNIFKKPKLLVVQWPVRTRFSSFSGDPYTGITYNNMISHSVWSITNEEVLKFLTSGDEIHYFKTTEVLTYLQINTYNIPTLHVSHDMYPIYISQFSDDPKIIMFTGTDQARDNHYGIVSHENLAEKLHTKYKELYKG